VACSKSWPQIIERRLQDRPFELEAEGSTRSGRRRGAINRSDMAQAIPDLPEFEAGRDLCWVAILRTAKRGEPPYVQPQCWRTRLSRHHRGIVLNVSKVAARVRAYVEGAQ